MNLLFAAQGTMILDSKPMCLVLDPGDQPETFGMPVNGNFLIIKIQSSGSMMIILYHTAHRNRQFQFIQHFQCNIDLPLSTIHQDQIRKLCKAAILRGQIFLPVLHPFLHSMRKPAGQHFPHGSIIVRSRHRF